MRFLHPPRQLEGLTVSTTHVTDSTSRVISSAALPWDDIPTPDGAFAPESITAIYHGAVSPEGTTQWTVNTHVLGRLRSRTGRKVGDHRSLWYLVTADQHSDERDSWPVWLVAWLEKYHPHRGGLGLDPNGSYL